MPPARQKRRKQISITQLQVIPAILQTMSEGKYDIKFISDGSAFGMCQVKRPEHVIPLNCLVERLLSSSKLSEEEKANLELIKSVHYTAFAKNGSVAYEQFSERRIWQGESNDVYLAELHCLGVSATMAWRAFLSRDCQIVWNVSFTLLLGWKY